MAYLLREGNVTVLHCDSDKLRAVHGVSEFFVRPTVTLEATYAVPRAGSSKGPDSAKTPVASTPAAAPTPVGDGEEMNGDVGMAEGVKAEEDPRAGWLIGEEYVKARAEGGWESDYDQKWPFRPSSTGQEDWEGRAYVMAHLLSLFGLKASVNTSPILLVPPPSPPSLPLPTQALWAQLAFEELNTPAFSMVPASLASLFALGATTGIVLHIGRDRSEITIVTDSVIRWECSTTVDVGYADCEVWLEDLLMKDMDLDKNLQMNLGGDGTWEAGQKEKLVKEVAHVIWTECTGEDLEVPGAEAGSKALAAVNASAQEDDSSFDVAKKLVGDVAPHAAASHKKKSAITAAATAAANKAAADAAAAIAADIITINIPSLPEKEITVGQVRHRLCEPLLRGKGGTGDTVWEGMGRAIGNATMSPADKMAVWEGVVVVGELARIKSFAPALLTHLGPFLLSSSELPSDVQPAHARLLSIPDYFANYKGATTDLAPFLGGSMVAKVAFSDQAGKHCITKVDYNAKGPAAVYSTFETLGA